MKISLSRLALHDYHGDQLHWANSAHALSLYRASSECYLSSKFSSARYSKHTPSMVQFRRFFTAMALCRKISTRGELRNDLLTSWISQKSENPTMSHAYDPKKNILQKTVTASRMLLSAVGLRRGQVSELVGSHMYRHHLHALSH
jgi:hypothetical protein